MKPITQLSNKQNIKTKYSKEIEAQIFRSEPLLQYHPLLQMKNYNDGFYLIYPVYNDTYILRKKTYGNTLHHVNEFGRQLKQITIKQGNILGPIEMFSHTQVICWHYVHTTKSYGLTIWNLETNAVIKMYCNRKLSDTSQMRIVLFSESKLICILEKQQDKNNRIRLEYYQWPIASPEVKPIHIYQADCDQLDNICKLQKLNNSSGICWIQKSYEEVQSFLLHIYDFRRKNLIQTFKFGFFVNQIPELFQIDVLQVWEPIQGSIYVRYKTELTKRKYFTNFTGKQDENKIQKILQQQKTKQCIWLYRQDKCKELRYKNQADHVIQFTNGLRYICRYKLTRKVQSLKSKKKDYYGTNPSYTKLPIFYVDPEQWQNIITIQQGSQQQLQLYNIEKVQTYLPKYNKYMYIQYDMQNRIDENSSKIQLSMRKINPYRHSINTIVYHMLLDMIENCDQVLLEQVSNLAHYDLSEVQKISRWVKIGI